MYNEQIRFTLRLEEPLGSNNLNDYILQDEPFLQDQLNPDHQKYWHDIPKTFERVKSKGGFTISYIQEITFVKKGRQLLKGYFDRYAPNGKAFLIVEIANPYTDVFELDYEGQIDMGDYQDYQEQLKVSLINGRLTKLINAQESEKFELDRTTFIDGEFTKPTDINGNEITQIEYKTNSFLGRKLKNQSYLENEEEFTHIAVDSPTLGDISTSFISNHFVKIRSDELVNDVIGVEGFRKVRFESPNWILTSGQFFYGPSDRNKTLNITFKGDALVNFTTPGRKDLVHFLVRAEKENNTENYIGDSSDDIIIKEFNGAQNDYSFEETVTISVKKGEVLAFITFVDASLNAPTTVTIPENAVSIFIKEDSIFPSSQSPCLTMHEAFLRTTEIITGNRNQFLSDLLREGYWSNLTISSGKMIRNLPKVNDDQEPLSQTESITTSIKELKSIQGYLNSSYGIEIHNGVEKLVVEDLKHFYRADVVIDLGEIYDVKEVPASEYYFNGAKFGNEKAGEYEEQFGIYETNALNEYGFPLNDEKEGFDGTSDLRSDAIPMELLRRKGFEYAPTEDTPYDKENFINDCKIVNGLYTPKLWQDVMEEQPKKVYDPDSAWNFTLTPLRSLFRHGWWFRTSLYKFVDQFVRYKSSTGFSSMIMKFPYEPEYAENGNTQISDLDRERFQAKYYDCKGKKTYELKKQLEGVTVMNGREIPNIYFLAQYTYESGEPQYAWIIKSELTREIKLRILKTNL